ncbi:MAG: MBL fold metallo-hydrolase [Chthoniobacteraceae bacterium]
MIPLEDSYQDILGKAQRGLKISTGTLTHDAGIGQADYEKVLEGNFDEAIVRKAAPFLKLDADRLVALGKKEWHPGITEFPDGLARTNTQFEDMTVNAYIVWDPATKKAAIFDTGADCEPLLKIISDKGLHPEYILLTHTHGDHIADLSKLTKATGASVHGPRSEVSGRAKPLDWGDTFPLGQLIIETRQTSGHAVGGTTYFIPGLITPVAVVGDAIFAGSMGGGAISYEEALRTNRENIFTLPDATILCPGHGPLTTVGLEKAHNPFYPEF